MTEQHLILFLTCIYSENLLLILNDHFRHVINLLFTETVVDIHTFTASPLTDTSAE